MYFTSIHAKVKPHELLKRHIEPARPRYSMLQKNDILAS